MLMLALLDSALSGILFLICSEVGTIIVYHTNIIYIYQS